MSVWMLLALSAVGVAAAAEPASTQKRSGWGINERQPRVAEGELPSMESIEAAMVAVNAPGETGNMKTNTYHFDSENGDDTHGTGDAAHPFRSLDKANSLRLEPGGHLLFKRGCVWRGQLRPQGSGAPGAPSVIDQYGEGDFPPLIEAGGAESAIRLHNQEYWTIMHINVSNRAADSTVARSGIEVVGKDTGALHGIRLADIRVHEVQGSPRSSGILIHALGDRQPTWFEGVTIDHCRVERVPHTGISLGSAWAAMPGSPVPKTGRLLPIAPWKDVVVSNNFVAEAGYSGILVRAADSPLICRNVVAASNWNLDANGYGVGLWTTGCIAAVMEGNEVYDTREPYCGASNGADGNAFNISRNLRCTYRRNFSHDNRGGFMLIDNYWAPSLNSGNFVCDNLSRDDELELFQIMGVGTTRIVNNIFHTGRDLDYKPCPFYCDPAGTPTDSRNIAEPSFDILCAGNVFSAEPGGCKPYAIMSGAMDFGWRSESPESLIGTEGGLDFGADGWVTSADAESGKKSLFLDRAEPAARGTIACLPRIRLHAVRVSGAGRVALSSDNVGNPPIEAFLADGAAPRVVETGWRFPAGVVTVAVDNPRGARLTHFHLIDYYSDQAYIFAHNHFVNLEPPGDDQREIYIVSLNNRVLADRSGLPAAQAQRLQRLLGDAFLLVELSPAEMPSAAWIAQRYPAGAATVARIEGEPVSALEWRLAAEAERPRALDAGLTDHEFHAASLRRAAADLLMRICAREHGLVEHVNVFAILFAMERANQQRAAAELSFGPVALREDRCLDYYHRNLAIRLKKTLRPQLQPTREQLDAYWEEYHKKVPWPSRAQVHVGMVKELIDRNLDQYIAQRLD